MKDNLLDDDNNENVDRINSPLLHKRIQRRRNDKKCKTLQPSNFIEEQWSPWWILSYILYKKSRRNIKTSSEIILIFSIPFPCLWSSCLLFSCMLKIWISHICICVDCTFQLATCMMRMMNWIGFLHKTQLIFSPKNNSNYCTNSRCSTYFISYVTECCAKDKANLILWLTTHLLTIPLIPILAGASINCEGISAAHRVLPPAIDYTLVFGRIPYIIFFTVAFVARVCLVRNRIMINRAIPNTYVLSLVPKIIGLTNTDLLSDGLYRNLWANAQATHR